MVTVGQIRCIERVIDAGGFRQDRATEDISIAWDHQLNDWYLFVLHHSFMEVPVTLKMLYRQRKRWAKVEQKSADQFQKSDAPSF